MNCLLGWSPRGHRRSRARRRGLALLARFLILVLLFISETALGSTRLLSPLDRAIEKIREIPRADDEIVLREWALSFSEYGIFFAEVRERRILLYRYAEAEDRLEVVRKIPVPEEWVRTGRFPDVAVSRGVIYLCLYGMAHDDASDADTEWSFWEVGLDKFDVLRERKFELPGALWADGMVPRNEGGFLLFLSLRGYEKFPESSCHPVVSGESVPEANGARKETLYGKSPAKDGEILRTRSRLLRLNAKSRIAVVDEDLRVRSLCSPTHGPAAAGGGRGDTFYFYGIRDVVGAAGKAVVAWLERSAQGGAQRLCLGAYLGSGESSGDVVCKMSRALGYDAKIVRVRGAIAVSLDDLIGLHQRVLFFADNELPEGLLELADDVPRVRVRMDLETVRPGQ